MPVCIQRSDKYLTSQTTDRLTFDKTALGYMRGTGAVGTVKAVQEALPPAVREVFSVVTHLGDPVFLGLLVVVFYYHRRDEVGEFVFGASLGAVALTTGLKGAIARPRPPSELRVVAESGYGLPSGHALGSTVVLFALAEYLEVSTRHRRYAASTVGVATIAFSRVAIGVHFPVDVVAGVAVGAVYLVLVSWEGPDPEVAFSAALTVAVIGVALGSDYRLGVGVGLPLGGYVGWHALADRYDFSDLLGNPNAVLIAFLPAVAMGMLLPAGFGTLAETAAYATVTAVAFVTPKVAGTVRQS